MDAIILAGGFGTRLQQVVNDVPKPMAPIHNIPFLAYLLDKLITANIKHVVLSTGYKHEVVFNYFGNKYKSLNITYSHESEPLFTGGAIRLALQKTRTENVIVLNGDTYFDIDIPSLSEFHNQQHTKLSIALRPIKDISRYGAVQLNLEQQIIGFSEKNKQEAGLINGGIYIMHRTIFEDTNLPTKFSFEKDFLETHYKKQRMYGKIMDAYFIDIGIPEDYKRAQQELPEKTHKTLKYLFLDRDGVINKRIVGGYVTNTAEFEFLPGVLEAMPILAKYFEKIIVVTNQQGIGKGIFTEKDLAQVHEYMCEKIQQAGGRIDKIYFCPDRTEENSLNRKPQIGMALQAKNNFPELDFEQSLMVGDAITDMEFGKKATMQTVFLTNNEENKTALNYTKYIYANLNEFVQNYPFKTPIQLE